MPQAIRVVDRLADQADVSISSPANGQVLTYNGSQWENQAAAGGGAPTGAKYITTATDATLTAEVAIPGLSASPDIASAAGAGTSEEYDTSTPGLTWSPSTPATVDSNTTIKSHLYILTTDAANERLGTKGWAPGAGAFDVRVKVAIGTDETASGSASGIALLISDSGHNNRLMLTLNVTPGSQSHTILAYTYSGGYTQRGPTWAYGVNDEAYLRITRDASNNVTFYWSNNGKVWQRIWAGAFTFTVANLGYRIYSPTAVNNYFIADWLRTSV